MCQIYDANNCGNTSSPLVLSAVGDITSEALVMSSAGQHDVILLLSHMTFMAQVIGWKQPWWNMLANKMLAVSKRWPYCHAWLKYSFNLWSEDSEDIIFFTQRFMEQAWWNLRNTLLSAHGNMPAMSFWYTTWTETKIVCMINNGPFVLWPKIENDTHKYMCTLHTRLATSGRRRSGSVRSESRGALRPPPRPHSVPCAGTWECTQTVTLHLPAD